MEGKPIPLNVELQNVKAAREIVRAAAFRTASVFGIPAHWLSYEVVTIADDDNAYFQLQVSLRVWDEQLWAQSSAFEQQVLKRIREDDRNVARAVRAVLWRILPDAGCPHDELSDDAAWRPDNVRVRAAAYDQLRGELALVSGLMPSVITGAAVGRPAASSTGFGETQPMSAPMPLLQAAPDAVDSAFLTTGFPATHSLAPNNELAPTQTVKSS